MSLYDSSPQLEGTWEMMRAETDGEAATDLLALGVVLTLAGGGYVVHFGGQVADRGNYALKPAEPTALTLKGAEGPNAGRTIPCLYQLMGNRLRVCYGLDGVAPTSFVTKGTPHRYLAIYRRQAIEGAA